jgi:hypothetical protein
MHIHCHSGTSSTRLQATLPGYGTVWFDPKGIADILSLSNLKKKYRVTFDSSTDNTFYVHKSDESTRKFVALQNGGGYISWTQTKTKNHLTKKNPLKQELSWLTLLNRTKPDIQPMMLKELNMPGRPKI